MKRKVLSDVELRSRVAGGSRIVVDKDTIITPAAMDYIRQHAIELVTDSMTVSRIPIKDGRARYVNSETGEELDYKPEEMTHLKGNLLVSKTHPRIRFRGELDSLIAEVVWIQTVALEENYPAVCGDLDEVLVLLRKVMAAEVKDEVLSPPDLLGMDSARLRYVTHHLKEELGIEHPVPGYKHGRMCAALNRLRTCVRKAELAASVAFDTEKGCSRVDIVEVLNRLSSCIYIMFCRIVAGIYQVGK